MWEASGSWNFAAPSVSMALYHNFTKEIHVLLVDHDKHWLVSTAKMLKSCSYKVTTVEEGAAALLMLLERKHQFDLMLAEIHLPEIDGFTLLQKAVDMDLPTILMSADEDATMARVALQNGACFFLEKPVSLGALKSLWQHVIREGIAKVGKLEDDKDSIHGVSHDNGNGNESKGSICEEENENETSYRKDQCGSNKKHRSGKAIDMGEEWNSSKARGMKKACAEWTDELHANFVAAVNQLGEGRCYPKEILQLMNVPGLTRMQVASHLQKCRNDKWRAPGAARKRNGLSNNQSSPTDNDSQSKLVPKKFGSMPGLVKSCPNATTHLQDKNLTGSEIYSSLYNSLLGAKNVGQPRPLSHPQSQLATQCSSRNEISQNSDIKRIEHEEEFGKLRELLTIDKKKNEADLMYSSTLDDLNDMSSENGHEKLASMPAGMISYQNSEPILSDPCNSTLGPDSRTSLENRNQFSQDLLDLAPEMNDHQSLSQLLEEPLMVEYSASPQQCIFDFNWPAGFL